MIPFNKPYQSGNELYYIAEAVKMGKISGNGHFTHKCHQYLSKRYGYNKCLLTTSGTDALEMAAILCDLQPGDEVIMPSFTFVSTANAFALRGAKIVFADSQPDHPNIDPDHIERLISPRTKAIVPVHYAGMSCDMERIVDIANTNNLIIVEDAAQGIESYHKDKALGSVGHLAAMSFHETKNIISGEGGMLMVNDERFSKRSEIIWEKGTNRMDFFRGQVDKYGWVDIGSSFLMSELNAAYLLAQLENLEEIQRRRISIYRRYVTLLNPLAGKGWFELPKVPEYATLNAHMFYLVLPSQEIRSSLMDYLSGKGIQAVFHYQTLHDSPYFINQYEGENLVNAGIFADRILRLPLFFELEEKEVRMICDAIHDFFSRQP